MEWSNHFGIRRREIEISSQPLSKGGIDAMRENGILNQLLNGVWGKYAKTSVCLFTPFRAYEFSFLLQDKNLMKLLPMMRIISNKNKQQIYPDKDRLSPNYQHLKLRHIVTLAPLLRVFH